VRVSVQFPLILAFSRKGRRNKTAKKISVNNLSTQPRFTIGKPIDNRHRAGDMPDWMRKFILI
jgi:hypothetical protein